MKPFERPLTKSSESLQNAMKITVILCTYNRASCLSEALESVLASALPPGLEWEILVVDNNSSDQTCAVAKEFCRRYLGRVRYLFEARQGLSIARNTGIQEADGDVLAFMDDDVTVGPLWLQNLTAPLLDGPWAGAGGPIRLQRDFTPPDWLRLEGSFSMGGALAALFDLGDIPAELHQAPYGTNMAYAKSVFQKYGSFRTDLGRSANNLIGKEDTEFGARLLAAGERLWYQPSAVVYHPVLQERVSKKYFLAWWFGCGRATVRERGSRPGVLGIPRYFFSAGMVALSALRWMHTFDPPKRFFRKCWVWMYAGKVVENYRQRRDEKLARTRKLLPS
jgi:glucosyl-dolichyl phosphate glucuronosyltransferase